MCEHAAECGLTMEPLACAAECNGQIRDAQAACVEATGIMLECFASLSCPAEDVCSDFTKLNDKAVSCCDFPSSGS